MHNKEPLRFLLIYGSQTGQAKAIAEEIAEQAPAHGLQADLHCFSLYGKKFSLETVPVAVIVTSTTGDGEPPDTVQKFHRRINLRTLTNTHLSHLNYALLGLGDSNYTNFCNCGKWMDKRLSELGAKRFYPTGYADDATGLEVVVEPWIKGLFPSLKAFLKTITCTSDTPSSASLDPNGYITENLQYLDLYTDSKQVAPDGKLHQPEGAVGSFANDVKALPIVAILTLSEMSASSMLCQSSGVEKGQSPDLTLKNKDGESVMSSATACSSSCQESCVSLRTALDSSEEMSGQPLGVVCKTSNNINEGLPSDTARASASMDTSDHLLGASVITLMQNGSGLPQGSSTTSDVTTPGSVDVAGMHDTQAITGAAVKSYTEDRISCINQLQLHGRDLALPTLPATYLKLEHSESCDDAMQDVVKALKNLLAKTDVATAHIVHAEVLTSSLAVKKTLCLQLDMKVAGFKYEPGDAFGIFCENTAGEVSWLLNRLRVSEEEADRPVWLAVMANSQKKTARTPEHIPQGVSLRQMFTSYVEIRAVPKKAFLCLLAEYTSNNQEQRRLQELSSREGATHYTELIIVEHTSLMDVLHHFPSCLPPVEIVLENLPWLRPRLYSAASSPLQDGSTLKIVFNIMQLRPIGSLSHFGVCTGWLDRLTEKLQENSETETLPAVSLFLRKINTFHLPVSEGTPLLLIAAGTGIAPFIGFLEHRHKQKALNTDVRVGEIWLFYGCRHPHKDFLFRDDLKRWLDQGTLTKCIVCFSEFDMSGVCPSSLMLPRDSQSLSSSCTKSPCLLSTSASTICDSSISNTGLIEGSQTASDFTAAASVSSSAGSLVAVSGRVQDGLVLETSCISELVWTRDAHTYVCGSSAMAKSVLGAMISVASAAKGVSSLSDATSAVQERKLTKKYHEEIWS